MSAKADKKNHMSRRGRKEFDKIGNTYFVTTTVTNFENALTSDENLTRILIDSLSHLINEHESTLLAYVIMPSHIHLLLYMPEGESLSDFMRDFKKYTSFSFYKYLSERDKSWLFKTLQKNSQAGKWKLWMDRFDSQIITSEKFYEQKINYIHNNPVRAGLVKEITDWKFSSARNYYLDDNSVLELSTGWLLKNS
jgi:putative transposase